MTNPNHPHQLSRPPPTETYCQSDRWWVAAGRGANYPVNPAKTQTTCCILSTTLAWHLIFIITLLFFQVLQSIVLAQVTIKRDWNTTALCNHLFPIICNQSVLLVQNLFYFIFKFFQKQLLAHNLEKCLHLVLTPRSTTRQFTHGCGWEI